MIQNAHSTVPFKELLIHGSLSVLLGIKMHREVIDPITNKPILAPNEDWHPRFAHQKNFQFRISWKINLFYPSLDLAVSPVTRQNQSTTWKQSKHRSESLVVLWEHVYTGHNGEGWGRTMMKLFIYVSFVQHPDDWHGYLMNKDGFIFILYAWIYTWPYLTSVSRRYPPTHTQILFYYGKLSGNGLSTKPYRANFSSHNIKKIISGAPISLNGHPYTGAKNSQIVGSNVLVYTEGNRPQTFSLQYPSDNYLQDHKHYKVLPLFQISCGQGTISALDPVDNLLMTHNVFLTVSKGIAITIPFV